MTQTSHVTSVRLILTDNESQILSLCRYKTEKSFLFFSFMLPLRERDQILHNNKNNRSTYSHKHYYTYDKWNDLLKIHVTDPYCTLCQNWKTIIMEVLHIIITNCISVEHTVHLMKHFQRNLYCLNDKPDIHNKNKDDQVMFYTILYTFTTCVFKDQVFMLEYIMQIAYEKNQSKYAKSEESFGKAESLIFSAASIIWGLPYLFPKRSHSRDLHWCTWLGLRWHCADESKTTWICEGFFGW